MAKKISKKINSKFDPTFVSGYPVYAYGGRMKPYSFGGVVTDGLKAWSNIGLGTFGINPDYEYENDFFEKVGGVANTAGKVGGQVAANVVAPGVGGAVMGGVQSAGSSLSNQAIQNNQQGDLLAQQQQEALKKQAISNLPAHHNYRPTFAKGGFMSEVAKGTKEEMEHTSSKKVAKKIAKEHVEEHPKYYTKLKKAGLADSYAGGGILSKLHGGQVGDLDNTSYMSTGGSHSQNPNGGIPLGKNALVEAGEYIWKGPKGKYVFSDRF